MDQSERDDIERDGPLEDEQPRAFTPLTPFGDAKPWAGSVLDPEPPASDEPPQPE